MLARNETDLHEMVYDLAVIESKHTDAVYGIVRGFEHEQWWYRWQADDKYGRFLPCETPLDYRIIFGFGVG